MALQGSEIESLTNFENLLKTMMEETDNNQLKHETEKFLFELDSLSKQARAAQKSLIDLYFTLANEPESDSPIIDSIAKAFSDNFNLNGIPRMRLNECSSTQDTESEVGSSSETDNDVAESLDDTESLADSILTKTTTTSEDSKDNHDDVQDDDEWIQIKKKKKNSPKLCSSLETNSIASSSAFSEDHVAFAKEYFGVMTSWTDLGPKESYGKIKCGNFRGKKEVEFFAHVSQLQFEPVVAKNLPTVAFQVGHYKNKALNVRLPKIWGN